jgi:hypothetical protein
MKPLPKLAPTINAAFFIPGTITIHWHFPSNSFGIALSGVAMIALMTSAVSFKRKAALSAANNIPPDNTPAPRQVIPSLLNLCSFISLSLVFDPKLV